MDCTRRKPKACSNGTNRSHIDHKHNFQYKKLASIQECLTKLLQNIRDILRNPHKIPVFITEGKTYVKPKKLRHKTEQHNKIHLWLLKVFQIYKIDLALYGTLANQKVTPNGKV